MELMNVARPSLLINWLIDNTLTAIDIAGMFSRRKSLAPVLFTGVFQLSFHHNKIWVLSLISAIKIPSH